MCLIVVVFSELSPCIADSADPSVWDVKDNTQFGVAEPNLEVTAWCCVFQCVCFAFSRVLINENKHEKFSKGQTPHSSGASEIAHCKLKSLIKHYTSFNSHYCMNLKHFCGYCHHT